jgi:hypothetical protein
MYAIAGEIGFRNHDRYGDRGAHAGDIPFKKGHLVGPVRSKLAEGRLSHQRKRYLLLPLGAVSTSIVEQRRAPTGSGQNAVEPQSAEFFGRPEQFAVNETVQLSFELFKGDTAFKPRDWAIKISPTFSIPNYVNARENGVINIDPARGTNRSTPRLARGCIWW